jgi:hypothetical protein
MASQGNSALRWVGVRLFSSGSENHVVLRTAAKSQRTKLPSPLGGEG